MGVLEILFILNLDFDTGLVIIVPILFVLIGLYAPFSKAAKQRCFAASVKRIEKGMHINDVKGILSTFHIEEERDIKNNYNLTYVEKGLLKGSLVVRSVAFKDNYVVAVIYEIENQQTIAEKKFRKISRISHLIMLILAFITLLMIFVLK